MKSIRTRATLLTTCAVIVTALVATLLGVFAIRDVGSDNADQMLLLLCEAGEKNLDSYFESVEQSVETLSSYVEADLSDTDIFELQGHIDRVSKFFEETVYRTQGVLTYYYRIDPAVSDTATGFWYVNLDGRGFLEHKTTDITKYDTNDTTQLVWFTVPKATGKGIWLPPYITDNLDVRVISYNVPIYKDSRFIGVVGIEIDYSTMASQVDNIKLYDNGYAFINDAEGTIVYHPEIDVTVLPPDKLPKVPEGLMSGDNFIRYTFEGVEKQAVWLELENGMRLNVTVPIDEINSEWLAWVRDISIVSVVVVAAFILISMRFTGHITKPLQDLTEVAAQVNEGNYDVVLDYDGDDEVGTLTRAFRGLIAHLKTYIGDLNSLAYSDALTSVHNKGAFDIHMSKLQDEIDAGGEVRFAIAVFDCNDLKSVNDEHGHEMGDCYIKSACSLICGVFQHSPVFRVGGDEFTAIIRNQDLQNIVLLLRRFDEACSESAILAEHDWERVDLARGVAIYNPEEDLTAQDTFRRADELMYENKRGSKADR